MFKRESFSSSYSPFQSATSSNHRPFLRLALELRGRKSIHRKHSRPSQWTEVGVSCAELETMNPILTRSGIACVAKTLSNLNRFHWITTQHKSVALIQLWHHSSRVGNTTSAHRSLYYKRSPRVIWWLTYLAKNSAAPGCEYKYRL